MRRLLWIGDAACDSGFAKATHNTLEGLRETWDVHVLGLNYRGDPHEFPYPIYPAYVAGSDLFGTRRINPENEGLEILSKVRPDLVVIQNDPWNIPAYTQHFAKLKNPPVLVGAIAVDGKNCRGKALMGLDHVIVWTEFAREEVVKGGFTKGTSVVPLGVDLEVFSPGDKMEARKALGLPEKIINGFYFLNINRNQPRKRLDLTVEAFAEFYHTTDAPDAFLYFHVCPTGDVGYDIDQLTQYYNLRGRVILAEPGIYRGSSEKEVALTYRAADAGISTSQGEGWGLTAMEGMACGLPQILPGNSAYGDWAKGAAYLLDTPISCVTPNKVNVIGSVPTKESIVKAMKDMYHSHLLRHDFTLRGLARVCRPEYRWPNIAESFRVEVEKAWVAAREAQSVA